MRRRKVVKKLFLRLVLTTAGLAAPWPVSRVLCLAAPPPSAKARAPSIHEIEKEIEGLEALWKAGKHCEYFTAAGKVAADVIAADSRSFERKSPMAQKAASQAAATLVERMLPRKLDVVGAADYFIVDCNRYLRPDGDLETIETLCGCVEAYGTTPLDFQSLRPPYVPPDVWTRNARLLADVVGRIRDERVASAKAGCPRPVDPEAVGDPEARDVARHRQDMIKADYGFRQDTLALEDKCRTEALRDYLIEALRRRKGTALLDDCAKRARLTDAEQDEILNRVKEIKKYDVEEGCVPE
jgi:hypothetical protein